MRGDISKLPKWAQNEIRRLERNERSLRARLEAGPEDSDTFADPYSSTPRPLGRGTTVEFRLGGERDNRIRATIERRGDEYVLYLNGGQRLIIQPESSNAATVETRGL